MDSSISQFDKDIPSIVQQSNTTKYTMLQKCRFQCGICAKIVTEHRLNKHHTNKHSMVPFSMNMYELYEVSERAKCNFCERGMEVKKMMDHQLRCHPNVFQNDENSCQSDTSDRVMGEGQQCIPYESDINANTASVWPCENPAFDDGANQCFRNVCISEREFQLLANQGRLYEQNGILFLKDSL